MLRPPGFYAPLEEALRQVQADKLDNGIDKTIGDTAPEVTERSAGPERAEAQPEFQPTDTLRPGFYAPLEEALKQVKADMAKGVDPVDAYQAAISQLDPTRPEGHPTDRLFHWPDSPSMPPQQGAAAALADLLNEHLNERTNRPDERSEEPSTPEPAREESPPDPARADDRHEPDQSEPDHDVGPEFDFGRGRDMSDGGLGG
jgi:hypothetical protein